MSRARRAGPAGRDLLPAARGAGAEQRGAQFVHRHVARRRVVAGERRGEDDVEVTVGRDERAGALQARRGREAHRVGGVGEAVASGPSAACDPGPTWVRRAYASTTAARSAGLIVE